MQILLEAAEFYLEFIYSLGRYVLKSHSDLANKRLKVDLAADKDVFLIHTKRGKKRNFIIARSKIGREI